MDASIDVYKRQTYNYGIAAPTVIPEMTNAVEYATLMNEIDKYAGNKGRYSLIIYCLKGCC